MPNIVPFWLNEVNFQLFNSFEQVLTSYQVFWRKRRPRGTHLGYFSLVESQDLIDLLLVEYSLGGGRRFHSLVLGQHSLGLGHALLYSSLGFLKVLFCGALFVGRLSPESTALKVPRRATFEFDEISVVLPGFLNPSLPVLDNMFMMIFPLTPIIING